MDKILNNINLILLGIVAIEFAIIIIVGLL